MDEQTQNPVLEQSSAYYDKLKEMADLNNSWSAEQAQKQMDFQERMSSSAHQREVADLEAAGLNPVLSARQQGASTPSGASASADTSLIPAMTNLFSQMIDQQTALSLAAISSSHDGGGGGGGGYYSNARSNSRYSNQLYKLTGIPYIDQFVAAVLGYENPEEAAKALGLKARSFVEDFTSDGVSAKQVWRDFQRNPSAALYDIFYMATPPEQRYERWHANRTERYKSRNEPERISYRNDHHSSTF